MSIVVPVRPLAGWIVVQPFAADTKTKSGLHIPGNAQTRPARGLVLRVGPPELDEQTGELIEVEVKEGERILYSKYTGSPLSVPGADGLLMMREADVYAIL